MNIKPQVERLYNVMVMCIIQSVYIMMCIFQTLYVYIIVYIMMYILFAYDNFRYFYKLTHPS